MFKHVDYEGFGGRPDLRVLADRGTEALAGEIFAMKPNVSVRWDADGSTDYPLKLTLALDIPGTALSAEKSFRLEDFVDDKHLRSRCRSAWTDLLDRLIRREVRRIMELNRTLAEV